MKQSFTIESCARAVDGRVTLLMVSVPDGSGAEDETVKTAMAAAVLETVKAANATTVTPARITGGCGRAYVVLSVTTPKAVVTAVAQACKTLGLQFLKRAYGVGSNAIYIGYDNADGRALAKSEAFARVLTERGIEAYADGASD